MDEREDAAPAGQVGAASEDQQAGGSRSVPIMARRTSVDLSPRVRTLRSAPPNAMAGEATELWAQQQVESLGVTEWPAYGSAAWLKLRAEDPRRVAAIVEAAELWRRQNGENARLEQLLADDPEAWLAEVVRDANQEAYRTLRRLGLSSMPTMADIAGRRADCPVAREVKASAGWPPIAIPGRPGWHRHLIDGQQVDRPDREGAA